MDSPADGTTSLEPQLRALEADLMDLEAQTSRLSSLTPLREQQLAELQKEVSTVQIDRARLRNDLDSLRHAMGKYRALVGASDKLEERRLAMQRASSFLPVPLLSQGRSADRALHAELCLTALAQAAQSSDSRTKGFSDEEIASLRRYWDSFEAGAHPASLALPRLTSPQPSAWMGLLADRIHQEGCT